MVSSTPEADKQSKLRDYDLVLIINPEIADEALEPVVNVVSQLITSRGGTITKIDRWGKKKLAYPLKHYLEGHYMLVSFKLDPALNRELDNNLKLTEQILRHMLSRMD